MYSCNDISHNDAMAALHDPVCNAAMAKDEPQAERRRRALIKFMEDRELEAASWARDAGLPNPNSIYNFLKGRSAALSQTTYQALAKAVGPGVTASHLTGELLTSVDITLPRIKVIGAVEAGAWREAVAWPISEQLEVAVPVAPSYTKKAFALRVNGPSMNLVYPDGTIIICVKFYDYNGALQNGDRVVVYRTSADGLIEATVKELVADDAGHKWLWPRSSDPLHQQPVELIESAGKKRGAPPSVEIHAVVIGSYRPERTSPAKR